jgi:hypothetical protein
MSRSPADIAGPERAAASPWPCVGASPSSPASSCAAAWLAPPARLLPPGTLAVPLALLLTPAKAVSLMRCRHPANASASRSVCACVVESPGGRHVVE